MKRLALLIAASLLSATVVARMPANTRQQCTRLCLDAELDNPAFLQRAQKLKEIRDKEEAETDPAKRKALEQAEREQIGLRKEAQEKERNYICEPLRDE